MKIHFARTRPRTALNLGILFFLSGVYAAGSNDQWQKVREKDGISIYKRSLENSRLLAFRAVSTIHADGDHIMSVLNDLEEHIHVTPGLIDLEVLRSLSEFDRYEYMHFKLPWPLKHRYAIIRSSLRKQPDGSIVMNMRSVDEPYTKPTSYVRGEVNFANILLKPKSGNPQHWEAIVEASVDPKVRVPGFMINWVFKEWPYQFLSRLNDRIQIFANNQKVREEGPVAESEDGENSSSATPGEPDAS